MKVGDLVKLNGSKTRKVFLVVERNIDWFKVLGCVDWQLVAHFEVVNESR